MLSSINLNSTRIARIPTRSIIWAYWNAPDHLKYDRALSMFALGTLKTRLRHSADKFESLALTPESRHGSCGEP